MAIFGKQIGQIISATASTIAAAFGSASSETPAPTDLIAFARETAAEAATAELEITGTGNAGSLLTVGNKTYTIVASSPGADEIEVGADAETFAMNIETAIDADTADTLCTAAIVSFTTINLTANTAGSAGNSIPLATDDDDITIVNTFENGADAFFTLYTAPASDFGIT